MTRALCAAFGAVLLLFAGAAAGRAADVNPDSHANYYYPPPQSTEVYRSPAKIMPDTSRERRLAFVTGITQQQFQAAYPPPYALFAKGDAAERLIVVTLSDNSFNTLYRARALFAMLTAVARLTSVFHDAQVDPLYTFFDLCKMLGFTSIVWSDGRAVSHEISLK